MFVNRIQEIKETTDLQKISLLARNGSQEGGVWSHVSLEMSNSEQLKAQMLRLLRRRGMRRRRRRDKPSHLTTPKGIVHTATWLLFFLP